MMNGSGLPESFVRPAVVAGGWPDDEKTETMIYAAARNAGDDAHCLFRPGEHLPSSRRCFVCKDKRDRKLPEPVPAPTLLGGAAALELRSPLDKGDAIAAEPPVAAAASDAIGLCTVDSRLADKLGA